MAKAQRILIFAAALFAASPVFACQTVDDVVHGLKGEHSRVTVISEMGALSRALSFMIGNADEVQTADALVVIQGLKSEVVLIRGGCAAMKALSSPELVVELLRRAKGEEVKGELI